MTKLQKVLLSLSVCFAILVLVLMKNQDSVFGSVAQNGEYKATTTRTFNGLAMQNGSILKNESGTLGSVVITGANTGVINLYDATSTITNSQYGTTTLVTIPASAGAGTYTFDLSFYRGLVVEIIGTAPTTTITYR